MRALLGGKPGITGSSSGTGGGVKDKGWSRHTLPCWSRR